MFLRMEGGEKEAGGMREGGRKVEICKMIIPNTQIIKKKHQKRNPLSSPWRKESVTFE